MKEMRDLVTGICVRTTGVEELFIVLKVVCESCEDVDMPSKNPPLCILPMTNDWSCMSPVN